MKLLSFSVANYRSITEAHEIPLGDMTVLVGKNNEGKSNILGALSLAMECMQLYVLGYETMHQRIEWPSYDWERDYPISMQTSDPEGHTSIDFLFSLSISELEEMEKKSDVELDGHIPINILINYDMYAVSISEKYSIKSLSIKDRNLILSSISKMIDFNFIPTIRTEDHSLQFLESQVQNVGVNSLSQ